jgi:PAS domain S-box-containing protein
MDGRSLPRAARLGWWFCVVGAALGALGLVDAVSALGLLTVVAPREPPMTANSALCLLLVGGAGAWRAREDVGRTARIACRAAAAAALGIALGTLFQYAFGIDLGLDRLVVHAPERPPQTGRPAPASAVAFAALGAALLLDSRTQARARPSEWLILAGGFAGLTALLGFLFGAELHSDVVRAPVIGMALPTAAGVLVVAIGLLLERPSQGLMRVATSGGLGGRQLRRFMLPAIVGPILLGLIVTFPLRTLGSEALAVVVAVLAAAMILVGLLVLALTAASLNRTYDALESSRAAMQTLVEQAPDAVFIADLAGRYTDVNGVACRMLGYTREELLGKTIADVIVPEDVERLARTKDHLLEGGVLTVSEWEMRRKDGSRLSTEVSAKIFADGRWQALVRDISDRKQLEKDLRAAEAEQKFVA